MTNTAQTLAVTPQLQPILEFRGNEIYGGSAAGLTIWNLGTNGYNIPTVSESVIKDFRVWHTYEAAIWNYPVNNVRSTGSPGDRSLGHSYWESAVQSGDYRDINLTIRTRIFMPEGYSAGPRRQSALYGLKTYAP